MPPSVEAVLGRRGTKTWLAWTLCPVCLWVLRGLWGGVGGLILTTHDRTIGSHSTYRPSAGSSGPRRAAGAGAGGGAGRTAWCLKQGARAGGDSGARLRPWLATWVVWTDDADGDAPARAFVCPCACGSVSLTCVICAVTLSRAPTTSTKTRWCRGQVLIKPKPQNLHGLSPPHQPCSRMQQSSMVLGPQALRLSFVFV